LPKNTILPPARTERAETPTRRLKGSAKAARVAASTAPCSLSSSSKNASRSMSLKAWPRPVRSRP
jgi:hypothetical protein